MGAPPPEAEEGAEEPELSELEMSAIAEAANQTMAAAAAAISVVLGQEIEISTPDTRVLDEPSQANDIYGTAPHATSTTFLIAGESCRLIQLIPAAFVVRMVRAMDELTGETADAGAVAGSASRTAPSAVDASPNRLALQEVLGGISLRVWAELGRARMPLGSALGLPVGSVLDLDRTAEAPVDLYVNGMRFARAQLLVTEEGEWAVSLESLEHEGLRLLEKARAARPEGREDVDPEPQAQESSPDLPIESEGSSTEAETPEAEAPENPETPKPLT